MGYGRFKQKFSPLVGKPVLVANARASHPVISFAGMGRGALGDRVSHRRDHSRAFVFAQENVDKFGIVAVRAAGSERSVSCRWIVISSVVFRQKQKYQSANQIFLNQ
jgi:hypothetical protein